LRIRQQEILAELGVLALQGVAFDELLGQTTGLTAEGLEAEFCKVMEYLPGENSFLVRAGVGWGANVIGKAKVGADLAPPNMPIPVMRRAQFRLFLPSKSRINCCLPLPTAVWDCLKTSTSRRPRVLACGS
jgi:hypothetical protein